MELAHLSMVNWKAVRVNYDRQKCSDSMSLPNDSTIPISPAPPTPPTNVMAMATSPRSITVMWEEVVPIDQNGVITMYQVLYQPLETFGGAIGPLTVNVTELTADLTDLEEYVNYTVSVRAYTSAGEGPYSYGITVITLEDGRWKCMFLPVFHITCSIDFFSSF